MDSRNSQRYDLTLPVHYRASLKGASPHAGTSVTCDMSTGGISFRCRRPLPVGAHAELVIEWPARYEDLYPIDLQITGFVVRSDPGKTAVSISSLRFRTCSFPAEPVRVSA